jgi:hypothetical protein
LHSAWPSPGGPARSSAKSQAGAGIGSRSLVIVALFATLVFAPVGAYFLAFEADWSYAYFIDARRIPSALQLALVLVDAASVPVIRGSRVVRQESANSCRSSLAGAPMVFTLSCLAATAGRLGIQATYAQYHGDFGTRPVSGSSLGYALLWMDTLLALGVAWTGRQVHKLVRA